jgi:hypothetical protein
LRQTILAIIAAIPVAAFAASEPTESSDVPSAVQPAILRVDASGDSWERRTHITEVDGKWGVPNCKLIGPVCLSTEEVKLSPGRHTVLVRYKYLRTSAAARMTFDVEAGKLYVLHRNPIGSFQTYGVSDAGPGSVQRWVETLVEFWIDGTNVKVTSPAVYE